MKKTAIFLAIFMIVGICATAEEAVPASQGIPETDLFSDIDAVALSQTEMDQIDGEGAGAFFAAITAADTITYWVTGVSPVRATVEFAGEAIDKWAANQPAPQSTSRSRAIARARSRG